MFNFPWALRDILNGKKAKFSKSFPNYCCKLSCVVIHTAVNKTKKISLSLDEQEEDTVTANVKMGHMLEELSLQLSGIRWSLWHGYSCSRMKIPHFTVSQQYLLLSRAVFPTPVVGIHWTDLHFCFVPVPRTPVSSNQELLTPYR